MSKPEKNDILEILLPYQKAWIEDESDQKIWPKSRRIGASWTEALNSILKAAPAEGHQNTYYLAYDKDMTRQFVSDCSWWAQQLDVAMSGVITEKFVDDEGKDVLTYTLRLSSGAEVIAMSSRAVGLRSKKGRLVFDEAAFSGDFSGVLKAAQAFLIWGGQISIISTHFGEDNPFNVLINDIKSGRDGTWSLHETTFSMAIEQGLYKRICLQRGEKWSQEKEASWINKIRGIYKDNIDEELNVIPSKSGKKYFSRGALDAVRCPSAQIVRWDFSGDFLYKKPDIKTAQIERMFALDIRPLLASFEGTLWMGMDFGRSGDLSVVWITEAIGTSKEVRMVVELKNMPFREQEQIIDLILSLSKSRGTLGGIAIDGRGNGQSLAENTSLNYPGYVCCVMATQGWYGEWFPRLRALIEDRDFSLPDDDVILSDFSIVVLKDGSPTVPQIRTEDRDGGKRHGDACIAAVMCVCAEAECAADPPPTVAICERRAGRLYSGY